MEGTKEGAFVRSAVPPVGEGGGINKAITATTMKERKKGRKKMFVSTLSTDYTGNECTAHFYATYLEWEGGLQMV